MERILVLGTGCAKCAKLEEVARDAASSLGLDAEVEKVTDLTKIMEHGVMVTPALVARGKVLVAGRVPGLEEARGLLAGVFGVASDAGGAG